MGLATRQLRLSFQDIISVSAVMDPLDPQWKDDPGMKAFNEFLAKDYPEGDRADLNVLNGFNVAQTLVHVLMQCGDNLTRTNVMRQAANLKDFRTTNLLARHHDQQQPERFCADRANAAQKVQGRKMGAVRAHTQQRDRRIERFIRSSGGFDPARHLRASTVRWWLYDSQSAALNVINSSVRI